MDNNDNSLSVPDNGVSTPVVQDTLNLFTADSLLFGTFIMNQVLALRGNLSRNSEGELISYDDMFLRIQNEVDDLPALVLELDISSGSEGAYQRQLLHALEKINDDCDRVLRKIIKLKSRLLNAKAQMTNRCAQFTAFFSLAVPVAIQASGLKHKFSMNHIKEMAESEFSRLMDNLDNAAPSMINELQILEDEVKGHKKTQAEKYQLGKDQVNAAWTSIQGNGNNGISLDDDPNKLLKQQQKFPVDEELDEIPTYVSRNSKEVRVAANASLEPRSKPEPKPDPKAALLEVEDEEVAFTRDPKPVEEPYDDFCILDTNCIRCGEKQFNTPSGVTCKNGHGGAEGVSREVKGTFVKQGDPRPITPIVDDGGEPLTVVFTPTSPPKQPPITFTMPEWSESRILELSEDEPGGIMAASPEIFSELKSVTDPDKSFAQALEESGFKPVTRKRLVLDETPIIEDVDTFMNEPEPLATAAPTSPRRKLILLDDEDAL